MDVFGRQVRLPFAIIRHIHAHAHAIPPRRHVPMAIS